ncbi:MAG: sugar transferase [Oceanihabitans sp.]
MKLTIKRIFDICFASIALLFCSPIIVIIALLIKTIDKGKVFYKQKRVGKNQKEFTIFKFKTMQVGSEKNGLLTIGNSDSRITKVGYFLRKYKLDEIPQFFNVLLGNMSIVGPRPELQHYVNYYTKEDISVFNIKPGITSFASIKFKNEVELLKKASNPEAYYLNTILPEKLKLNKQYVASHNLIVDLKIILQTFFALIKG